MKKLCTLIILSLLLLSISCRKKKNYEVIPPATTPTACENSTYFTKLYDKLDADNLFLTQTGSLLMSYSLKTNLVTKIDTNGSVLWQKTLGSFDGFFFVFRPYGNNQYYAQYTDGKTMVYGICDEELNFSKELRIPLPKFYSEFKLSERRSALLIGQTIVMVDSDCNKLWEYTDTTGLIGNIDEHDNGYYLTGAKQSAIPNTKILDVGYAIKIDKQGNTLWKKSYDWLEPTLVVTSIVRVVDTSGIVSFLTEARSPDDNRHNIAVALDINKDNGDMIRYYLNSSAGRFVDTSQPKRYAAIDGHYEVTNGKADSGKNAIVFTKYDIAEQKLWEKKYTNVSGAHVTDAVELPGGSIMILGDIYYYDGKEPYTQGKRCLIKMDKDGNTCY